MFATNRRLPFYAFAALALVALVALVGPADAQDNAPYGPAAWDERTIVDHGAVTQMEFRNQERALDAVRVDGDTHAACYMDATNSTTSDPDVTTATALMFAVTNNTGQDWTIRKVNELVDEFSDCSIDHVGDGNFGIAYVGGGPSNALRWLNFTETEDWGQSWSDTTVDEPTGGARSPKLAWIDADSWELYAEEREGAPLNELFRWNTTDDFATVTQETVHAGFRGGSRGINLLHVGTSDIWISGPHDDADGVVGNDACRVIHWQDGVEVLDWNLTTEGVGFEGGFDGRTCEVHPLGDDAVLAALQASSEGVLTILMYRTEDGGDTEAQVEEFNFGTPPSDARHRFLETNEGIFFSHFAGGDPVLRVCESDDLGSTWGCDTAAGPERENSMAMVRVNASLPGVFYHISSDPNQQNPHGVAFAHPAGGNESLGFTEVDTEVEVTADFEQAGGVHVTYSLSSPRVWVRDRHDPPTPSKVYRFATSLVEQERSSYCSNAGLIDALVTDGLGVTLDNRPVAPCRLASNAAPVIVTMDTFGDSDHEYAIKADSAPQIISALTGNNVAWVTTTQDQVEQGDVVAGSSSVRNRLTLVVDISEQDDDHWVTMSGPDGTFTFTRIGGSIKASATAENWESVQANGTDVWGWDTDADQAFRTVLSGGTYTRQALWNESTERINALKLSHDSQYLLGVQGNDRIALLNATSMEVLAKTTILPGVLDAAMDGCNNHIFAVNGTHLVRYDVGNFTSCEAFGGTDGDVTNLPPASEPIGDDPDEQTDDTSEVGDDVVDSTALGPFGKSRAAAAFGVDEGTAGWLLGGLLILGLTVGAFKLTGSEQVSMGGGAAALAISTGLTWIPLWFTVTLGVIAAAVIVFLRT